MIEWRVVEKLPNGIKSRQFIDGMPTNRYKLGAVGLRGADPNLTRIVGGGNDDGYEQGDGVLVPDSSTILVASRTDPSSAFYRAGGFRYTNITIPGGSTIDVAYQRVFFESASDPGTYIYGHDTANAGDLSANPHIIPVAFRPRTSASAYWYEASALSSWQNTPSLVSIVQEIIDLPGWSSGNAIMFLWIPITSENFKLCFITAREGYFEDWHKIYIEWTEGAGGWAGKISGVTNPAKVMGVDVANIAKVKGVASS